MGKQNGKKAKHITENSDQKSPRNSDKDTEIFAAMSRELREEGNKLFQKRDHEGAMLKYEKALRLLPRSHTDVAYLRSNLAACYMQMGLGEYPRAINECNLALEATPKYTKALLKRARCYEALNRLDLALRDVTNVLTIEPNNVMASEIAERVKVELEKKGLKVNSEAVIELPHDYVEPQSPANGSKEKIRKNNKKKKSNVVVDKKAIVVEEKISDDIVNETPKRSVKLVLGEDIRWAQVSLNCSLAELREVVNDRFPNSRAVLIKYRDQEGDLITITSDEELRLAEVASDSQQGSIRFYLVEVDPKTEPIFEKVQSEEDFNKLSSANEIEPSNSSSPCVEDWIIQFAQIFKSHVGFESDSYLSIQEIGMKLYSEAMEETVTSDEAQEIFDTAGEKFREMAALALLNWGYVHMSRARKKLNFSGEEDSRDSILAKIRSGFDWARREYSKAGERYEEAVKMKPDLHEGYLALGQQKFELAKLSWYSLESSPTDEIIELYNSAEENMEKGFRMWEEWEERRVKELTKSNGVEAQIRNMGLEGYFKEVSKDEAVEQASSVRSKINLLWGTMLYERSIVEFKLGLPIWNECFEVALEKFGLAGASQTDIAVMVKNHCSNNATLEGLGFKIDEIVQAWNEMHEAKKLRSGVPSFRLEPLLRRRASKLYDALEHV